MHYNLLITGASGFIGKNLFEHFSKLYNNVYAPNHQELELLDEKKIKEFLEKNQIKLIINCASKGVTRNSTSSFDEIVNQNVQMYSNLANNLKKDMRMIHLGSGAEYDKTRPLIKIEENDFGKSIPQDAYGYSKYKISKFIEPSKNVINLRLFGVYGKYENYSYRFISNSIIKNILKMNIVINKNVFFDYLFIDDFLNIVELLINNSPTENIFNVTPSQKIDLISIAEIINEISDHKSNIILENDILNNEYSGNNKKLLAEISEYNFSSYTNGIKKLYNYYKQNISNLDLETVKQDNYLQLCKKK